MRIKNRLQIIFLAVLLSLTAGCRKNDCSDIAPSGNLVNVVGSQYFAGSDDLKDFLKSRISMVTGTGIADLVMVKLSSELAKLELRNYLDVGVNPDNSSKLVFELHRFTYRTVNSSGSPIVLSGTLLMPNNTDSERQYEMDHVTLYNESMIFGSEYFPLRGIAGFCRVVYNSLVVFPDLQGYGSTCSMPAVDLACVNGRQSVDCEMAALELIRQRGVTLKKDYGTYLMGASRGGFATLSAQKYLETEASASLLKAVNPIGSITSSTPTDLSALLDYYLSLDKTENMIFVLAILNELYNSSPDLFSGYKLQDLFSDRYNASTLNELICSKELTIEETQDLCAKSGIESMYHVLNASMFNPDSTVNTSSPLYLAIRHAAERNNPCSGWTPSICKCVMIHSENDDVVPYSIAYDSYQKLSLYDRLVPNDNVLFKTKTVKGHVLNTMMDQISFVMDKDPVSSYFEDL